MIDVMRKAAKISGLALAAFLTGGCLDESAQSARAGHQACDHDMSDGLSVGPDGVQIAYYQDGLSPCEAPSIVMLHGWPDNHHVFDAAVDGLAGRYHLVRYDLRGVGGSDKPPADAGHYKFARNVDDLRALVDHLDLPAFHLVGHDWGGAIGYEASVTPDVRDRMLTFTNISGPSVDQVSQGFTPEHFDPQSPGAYLYLAHIWYIPVLMAPAVPELLAETGVTSFLVQLQYALDDGDYNSAEFEDHQWSNLSNLYRENIPERSQNPTFSHVPGLPLMQAVMPVDDTYVPPYYWDGKEKFHELMWKRPVDGGHWKHQSDPGELIQAIDEAVAWSESGASPDPAVLVFEGGSRTNAAAAPSGEGSAADTGSGGCAFNLLQVELGESVTGPHIQSLHDTGSCLRYRAADASSG